MKKGTFLGIMFTFLCFSCSMVDESAMGTTSKGEGNIAEGAINAAFSVDLSLADLKTKSDDDQKDDNQSIEKTITNGIVFLLAKGAEGDDSVYKVEAAVDLKEGATTAEFFTKSGDNKYLYAVTNVSDETIAALKSCTTLGAIKNTSLNGDDLSLYPKASAEVQKINFSAFDTKTEGNREVLYLKEPLAIRVEQRAAIIRLKEVKVKEGSVAGATVAVTSVKFENLNIAGLVDGEATLEKYEKSEGQDFSANSFQNTNGDSPIQVTVSYTVTQFGHTDSYTTQAFVINRSGVTEDHDYVKSNHIYDLVLNMTITQKYVDADLVCNTNDWIYTPGENDIEGEMTQIK